MLFRSIEELDGIDAELRRDFDLASRWERAKFLLEDNDGAGNTFKATAKPVLIGTAVVGATTMIFSIIIGLTDHLSRGIENLSLMHAPFLLGLIAEGRLGGRRRGGPPCLYGGGVCDGRHSGAGPLP